MRRRPDRISACLLPLLLLIMACGDGTHFADTGGMGLRTLKLDIGKDGLRQLNAKRDEALERGVLVTEQGDWVSGEFVSGSSAMPVKVRLKGDWTDHLRGEKWSYRIKLEEGFAWQGMTSFSLQNPESRNYLMEWVFHRYLQEKDLLTTPYDFVRLHLNERDLGIYAIEGHFTPELLSRQHRPPGPILKLEEDGVWEVRAWELARKREPDCDPPVFEAATISLFGENQLEDPEFAAQFRIGQALLEAARRQTRPHEAIFDLRRAARRHAATDLFRAFHSLTWHNQRWHYNPVTSRLEAIVYDGYPGADLSAQWDGPFSGYRASALHIDGRFAELMDAPFYRDSSFLANYYAALHAFVHPDSLAGFHARIDSSLRLREKFLRQEYPLYRYDPGFLQGNAQRIRDTLALTRESTVLQLSANGIGLRNRAPFPLLLELTAPDGSTRRQWIHAYDPAYPEDSIRLRKGEKYRVLEFRKGTNP